MPASESSHWLSLRELPPYCRPNSGCRSPGEHPPLLSRPGASGVASAGPTEAMDAVPGAPVAGARCTSPFGSGAPFPLVGAETMLSRQSAGAASFAGTSSSFTAPRISGSRGGAVPAVTAAGCSSLAVGFRLYAHRSVKGIDSLLGDVGRRCPLGIDQRRFSHARCLDVEGRLHQQQRTVLQLDVDQALHLCFVLGQGFGVGSGNGLVQCDQPLLGLFHVRSHGIARHNLGIGFGRTIVVNRNQPFFRGRWDIHLGDIGLPPHRHRPGSTAPGRSCCRCG